MALREGTTARQSVSRELTREGRVSFRLPPADHPSPIGKLSANVDVELYERLRELAHVHRVSESSIVDLALRRFFAVGDDGALGAILHESGATLRRKQTTKRRS
jgi:hypothetical protein